jgi:predicted dehydrogenase
VSAKARDLLANRCIAMVQQHYYMPGLPDKPWWPKLALSGGQLTEQATHMLDLGRFLAGDVEEVTARTTRAHDWTPAPGWTSPGKGLVPCAEGLDIPDTTAVTLKYASGALGTLSCSMVPGTRWDNGFRIVADGLLLRIDGADALWQGDAGEGKVTSGPDWPSYVLYDFLDAVIEGRGRTGVPYDAGIKSLAISLAGYASVRRGGTPVNPRDLLLESGLDL